MDIDSDCKIKYNQSIAGRLVAYYQLPVDIVDDAEMDSFTESH